MAMCKAKLAETRHLGEMADKTAFGDSRRLLVEARFLARTPAPSLPAPVRYTYMMLRASFLFHTKPTDTTWRGDWRQQIWPVERKG